MHQGFVYTHLSQYAHHLPFTQHKNINLHHFALLQALKEATSPPQDHVYPTSYYNLIRTLPQHKALAIPPGVWKGEPLDCFGVGSLRTLHSHQVGHVGQHRLEVRHLCGSY